MNDTAEYRASTGAVAAQALAAYDQGATGKGIKIAIADTGLHSNLAEFAGRVDPASRDLVSNRPLADNDYFHGTQVAAVAAAARNGAAMQGVAYEATILALKTNAVCEISANCTGGSFGSDLGKAIDVARVEKARIINLSVIFGNNGSLVVDPIRRAADAGILMVVAAGNEGAPSPQLGALEGTDVANGLLIIAGAHEANRTIAGFSNRAGHAARHYLTALGIPVATVQADGQLIYGAGTSSSAPIISGAAALLMSAFPHLSGRQVVEILFKSADDAGAPGIDDVFGNGILNIARAFQPVGETSLAGTSTPVSMISNGRLSGPMGDARALTGEALVLDSYSRAYRADLGRTLLAPPQEQPLHSALTSQVQSASTRGALAVSLTVAHSPDDEDFLDRSLRLKGDEGAGRFRSIAGAAIAKMTPNTAIAFGMSESGRALEQRLAGQEHGAFIVAPDPQRKSGFHSRQSTSIAARHRLGKIALTVSQERGEVASGLPEPAADNQSYASASAGIEGGFGTARLSLGLSRLSEKRTVLGARFDPVFSAAGGNTLFLDAGSSVGIGRRWRTSATYRRGWTSVPGTGGLATSGRLASEAWMLDLAKDGAFASGDRIGLRLVQPLRLSSGGFDLNLPISYDRGTGAVGYARQQFNLAPSGRELSFEGAYSVPLYGGSLAVNGFFRNEAGHSRTSRDQLGAAVRFGFSF